MRATHQISGLKRRKKSDFECIRLYVLPSEVFPESWEGTRKRYLSMTVEVELVKATKNCCENPFCQVTQL